MEILLRMMQKERGSLLYIFLRSINPIVQFIPEQLCRQSDSIDICHKNKSQQIVWKREANIYITTLCLKIVEYAKSCYH